MEKTGKPMSDAILSVEHLSMKFGGLVAVNDLSFEARRGEITALIGPNGAGKTTVFNCITGFYKPTEGMLNLKRKNGETFLLERMPDFMVNKKAKVARTFQNIRLFTGLTLLENLLVAQHNELMKASGYTIMGLIGMPTYKAASAHSVDKAKHWLERIGLVDRADLPAGDLPYGAQRRMEIARAMCTDPELLCLDEPAAGLNPRESQELNTLLTAIPKETGTSILLIEHDMSVVMGISDHVVVLEYGTKISDGTPKQVQSDPKVIAAYLGVDEDEVSALVSSPDIIVEGNMAAQNETIMAAPLMAAPAKVKATTAKAKPEPRAKATSAAQKSEAAKAPVVKPAAKKGTQVAPKQAPNKAADKAIPPKSTVEKGGSVTKPAAKPVASKTTAPKKPDDLKLIKGIGPVNDGKLRSHGVTSFKQIAAWKQKDIVEAEKYLQFDGRIAREDWVGQAKVLAKGGKPLPGGEK